MGESEQISARKAWHDTYFIRTPDTLEALAQNSTVKTVISQIIWERARDLDNPDYHKKLIVGSHMSLTGTTSRSAKLNHVQPNVDLLAKVKRCIQSLPDELQLFGHYFYGPFADKIRDQLAEFVLCSLYCRLEQIAFSELKTQMKRYAAMCILRALSESHYMTIFGGDSLFKSSRNQTSYETRISYSPYKICDHIAEKYKMELNPKNWKRDYELIHDAGARAINEMERRSLGPVSGIIFEYSDRKLAVH